MIVCTTEQMRKVVKHFSAQQTFVFDIESRIVGNARKRKTGEGRPEALDPRINDVFWISLATTGMSVAIPMGHPNGRQIGTKAAELLPGKKTTKRTVPVFSPPPAQLSRDEVVDALWDLFFSDRLKVGFNVKFDLESWDKFFGRSFDGPFEDCMVLQQKLDENWKQNNLGALVKKYLGHALAKEDATNLNNLPFNQAARYSRKDAAYTWYLYKILRGKVNRSGLDVLCDFEQDVTAALYRMERAGAPVDMRRVPELRQEIEESMALLEAELYAEAGQPFNLNASTDKGWFVFDVRKHKPLEFTEKLGQPSTAKTHLERFEWDPMVAKMGEWTALSKLKSTYVDNLDAYQHNGRIHANFRQTGTVTGRFSCSEPNLQNIPRPDKPMSKRVRDLFAAPPGHKFIVADYSQIELRILAHYTRDKNLLRAFTDGLDIHQMTADLLHCERTVAKSGNFLIVYGGWVGRLMATAGCDRKTAEKFFAMHQETYPRVWNWIREQQDAVQYMKGVPYVETLLGHRRRLPLAKHPDRATRQGALRQAVNAPIQGTAADIVKMAMVNVDTGILRSETLRGRCSMVLQIHDEIVLLVKDDVVAEAEALLREAMLGEAMQQLRVPLEASVKVVQRWSEAK